MEKWPFSDQNHGLTPLEKSQFFDLLTFFFYELERRFFVLEYCKAHFPGLYYLKKRQGKMAIFSPKLWKNLNFSTFWTCCFYKQETRFFVLEYFITDFPGLYCLKKKTWINGQFLTKTMGLEKSQFFDFLKVLFL